MKLVIFSGTTEGRKLSGMLSGKGIAHIVCVATEYGREVMEEGAHDGLNIGRSDRLSDSQSVVLNVSRSDSLNTGRNEDSVVRIHVGRMDEGMMERYLEGEGFRPGDCVVDATHPYAVEVSEHISAVADSMKLKRIRIRRDTVLAGDEDSDDCKGSRIISEKSSEPGKKTAENSPETNRTQTESFPEMHLYDSVEECAVALKRTSGNVLLTTGSKELEKYGKEAGMELMERTFVRVLPVEESIEACRMSGVEAGHIIALKGPFSEEDNVAVMNELKIRHLVSKESGTAGGFPEKRSAAGKLGVTLHVIKRPGGQEGVSIEEALLQIEKLFAEGTV